MAVRGVAWTSLFRRMDDATEECLQSTCERGCRLRLAMLE
jgi:hypothetical protein